MSVSAVKGATSSRGLFIVLEGGEGSGKTTQAALLTDWLNGMGVPHRLGREPGGTPVGEAIRELLLEKRDLKMPARTELLLMLAARAAFVSDVVRPALEEGRVMIADRFEYSTFVYQGIGRDLGLERTRELNGFATDGLQPDLVLVLDVPPGEGVRRQREGGKMADRIEGEGEAFMARIRDGYRKLAAGDPVAHVVPARGETMELHLVIRQILRRRFPETFGPPEG